MAEGASPGFLDSAAVAGAGVTPYAKTGSDVRTIMPPVSSAPAPGSGVTDIVDSSASAPSQGPYRSMGEVRNRGRWRAKTSVLRYGKSHALGAAAAIAPANVHDGGLIILRRQGRRPERAMQ